MPKRILKPKTRNNGTMTEAAFWGMIRALLRKKSLAWKPMREAKLRSRREIQNPESRAKFEYKCIHCKNWFPEKEIEVDHIIEAGSLTCSGDLAGFVERLFCEVDGLQILCKACHKQKTHK